MMRKGWWALVVLAAVFAMHGLQCLSDDSHPLTGHGVHSTVVSLSVPATSGGMDPAVSWNEATAPHAADHGGPESPRPAPEGSATQQPANFWAVCLAVLSAGLALLGAVLRRPGSVARPPAREVRAQTWSIAPALRRPPDLFALCVMRT